MGAFELMLPDAEDGPAAGADGADDEAVAGSVGPMDADRLDVALS